MTSTASLTANSGERENLYNDKESAIQNDYYDDDDEADANDLLSLNNPLPREPFRSPTFSPTAFLAESNSTSQSQSQSSYSLRYTSLPDLITELRARSSLITSELSALVNDEYASFIELGASLRGGEQSIGAAVVATAGVEDEQHGRGSKSASLLRKINSGASDDNIGGLGLQVGVHQVVHGLQVIQRRIKAMRQQVERLVGEREAVFLGLARGGDIVRVGQKVEMIEKRLAIISNSSSSKDVAASTTSDGRLPKALADSGDADQDDKEDDNVEVNDDEYDEFDEEEDGEEEIQSLAPKQVSRLKSLATSYMATKQQIIRLGGEEQPYMAKLLVRMQEIRRILLLDLSTALKQARSDEEGGEEQEEQEDGAARLLLILGIYSTINEAAEALSITSN